jgi:septal ring factor EnvC (AmiA/AmiB activator)
MVRPGVARGPVRAQPRARQGMMLPPCVRPGAFFIPVDPVFAYPAGWDDVRRCQARVVELEGRAGSLKQSLLDCQAEGKELGTQLVHAVAERDRLAREKQKLRKENDDLQDRYDRCEKERGEAKEAAPALQGELNRCEQDRDRARKDLAAAEADRRDARAFAARLGEPARRGAGRVSRALSTADPRAGRRSLGQGEGQVRAPVRQRPALPHQQCPAAVARRWPR